MAGPNGYVFAEPRPTPEPPGFFIPANDQQYYSQVDPTLVEEAPRTIGTGRMALSDVVGADRVAAIKAAGQIVFHSGGDTGPSKTAHFHEAITEAMAADFQGNATDPAFFYHLGDVIYNFGEAEYYYEQFYEPYRNYNAPIFAIPGNHDGVVYQGDPTPSLYSFQQNFCTNTPQRSLNSGGLSRTTMTQPGVYFTLEAPFVAIIGLYSNVLEGPGVISSEGGRYPELDERQVDFLTSELQRLAPMRADPNNDLKAVILAVHHPPFSADELKPGSESLVADIDRAVTKASLMPDAVLSGHAHNYQRFIRRWPGNGGAAATVPFIIAGSAGHNAQKLKQNGVPYDPTLPQTAGDHTWTTFQWLYGYLWVAVDSAGNKLTIQFRAVDQHAPGYTETTVVDLANRQVVKDAAWDPAA